jgi:hypothetical protein
MMPGTRLTIGLAQSLLGSPSRPSVHPLLTIEWTAEDSATGFTAARFVQRNAEAPQLLEMIASRFLSFLASALIH